jgi:hypothetical protein
MTHCYFPFNQGMTQKKINIKHHIETRFEDPFKGDFFNYNARKDLCPASECMIRKGLHLFCHGPGAADGKPNV